MLTRTIVAGFFFALAAAPTAADPAFDRVVDAAKASYAIPDDLIETAKSTCATALCFAEALAAARPDRLRLEPVDHPDTDVIRWVTTAPSVSAGDTADSLKLTHFGRKALPELRAALTATGRRMIELDLRGNPGGDFERMLQLVGFLLGPIRDAVEIDHGDSVERRSLQGPSVRNWEVKSVEIDRKSASAALLLSRLIMAHTDARLRGPAALNDPVFLKRRITIDHDWRLILPVAKVRIVPP